LAAAAMLAAFLTGAGGAALGSCGPFADFTDAGFCHFVLEIFYLNITTGVTPTTYDPTSPVSRLQMAVFLARTVDRTVQHVSSRTILQRFWTPQDPIILRLTTVGTTPSFVRSDGRDVWVSNAGSGSIFRLAGDGTFQGGWSGATNPRALVVVANKIFAAGRVNPGTLYEMFRTSRPASSRPS
jgi:hypothetical protein